MRYVILGCIGTIILIAYSIWAICHRLPTKPLDDMGWKIDYEDIYAKLYRFISSHGEVIQSLLGIQNAKQVLANGIDRNGFCILTDKACYFVGHVHQKKWFISTVGNIQHRIVNSELKGIKLKDAIQLRNVIGTVLTSIIFIIDIKGTIKLVKMLSKINEYSSEISITSIFVLVFIIFIIICFFLFIYYLSHLILVREPSIQLEFSSETVIFPVYDLGELEIKRFYKSVSKAQEVIINEVKSPTTNVVTMVSEVIAPKSKVESLSELSKLYEQKLITQDEFDKLKKEIIDK